MPQVLAPQASGYGIWPVVEFPYRLVNPLAELLAHEACLVGHVEDGCDGNRCPARDIAHSNHLFPLSDRLFNYELERGELKSLWQTEVNLANFLKLARRI